VAFSPDSRTLAMTVWTRTMQLWNVADGTLQFEDSDWKSARRVGWSGRRVAFGDSQGDKQHFFSWDTQEQRGYFTETYAPGFASVLPPDELIPDVLPDAWEHSWPIADGAPFCGMTGGSPYTVAVSPDGTTLAYSVGHGGGSEVRIWSTADRRVIRSLERQEGWVFGLCWSPDGRFLAAKSAAGTVRLWDTTTGRVLAELVETYPPWRSGRHAGHPRPVFHPSRPDRLATFGEEDHIVRVWELDLPALLDREPPPQRWRDRIRPSRRGR